MGRDATGLIPKGKKGPEQRAALAKVERAKAALDDTTEADSLELTRKAIRAKYPRRQLQGVFDEVSAAPPGKQALALVSAMMLCQATEERRLLQELDKQYKKKNPGKATIEGIRDQLQELRRATRHLKTISDSITKAAKVAAEIDLGSLPAEVRVVGPVGNVWAGVIPDKAE